MEESEGSAEDTDIESLIAALESAHPWLGLLSFGGAWWVLYPWPAHVSAKWACRVLPNLVCNVSAKWICFCSRAGTSALVQRASAQSSKSMTIALLAAAYVWLDPAHQCAFRAASDGARDAILAGLAIVTTLLALGIAIPGSALFLRLRKVPKAVVDYANVFYLPFFVGVPALVLLSVEDDASLVYSVLEPGTVVLTSWLTWFAIGQILRAISYALHMFIIGALHPEERPPN